MHKRRCRTCKFAIFPKQPSDQIDYMSPPYCPKAGSGMMLYAHAFALIEQVGCATWENKKVMFSEPIKGGF